MAKRRRKTLPVCPACHNTIHTRQPAATSTQKSLENHLR
jgi:predicted HNH restriction endonuclease